MLENRFIVLTNHRSGSSHFLRLLDSHPKIKARQEILRKAKSRTKAFLEDLFYESRISYEVFGFKLMYTHISPQVDEFMRENKGRVKIIQLIRRDLLETAIWHRGNFVGESEGGMGPRLVVKGSVTAKIPEIICQMKETKSCIDKYRSLADFTAYYEDFVTTEGIQEFKDEAIREELLKFLGVEDNNLFSAVNIKNVRPPSSVIVTNWDELVVAVKEAGLEAIYDG